MNSSRTWIVPLAVAGLVLALGAPAWASRATLIKTEGKVWVTPPQGQEKLAAPGLRLDAGTRIRTGPSSRAELEFENGSVLKVRPNTSLSLSGHSRASRNKNSIVLFFGRLWSKVVKGEEDHHEIKTANAVCGVRGTEFETAVADDGSVRVEVTEGRVAVSDDKEQKLVGAGHGISGDESGTGSVESGSTRTAQEWQRWEDEKRGRLASSGRQLTESVHSKIMARKAAIEKLREEQKALESKRAQAERRARGGDRRALEEVRQYNAKLAQIADEIADLGDQAASQFGLVDHYADLAERFKYVDRKYIASQAASLRRVRDMLDAMVADGTNISMEAMDKLLEDMGSGKGGELLDKKGSTADDLFGDDDLMR